MGFPGCFGAVTPMFGPCVGRAFQLLDLVGLPLRHFVYELQDRLLSRHANLNKFHNGTDFIASRKNGLSLAGRNPVQLWPTDSEA